MKSKCTITEVGATLGQTRITPLLLLRKDTKTSGKLNVNTDVEIFVLIRENNELHNRYSSHSNRLQRRVCVCVCVCARARACLCK